MSFNSTKSFDVDNGISLGGVGSPGVFSGTGAPTGFDAPIGSRYYQSDGSIWNKETAGGGGWLRRTVIGQPNGVDHNNLFSSDANGQNITTGAYETYTVGPAGGASVYPPTVTYKFIAVAQTSSGGTVDVRLFNLTDAVSLAVLSYSAVTVPTFMQAAFTLTGSDKIVEVQARRTGGTGQLFEATLLAEW